VNRVDWIALGVIAIAALSGLKRGLIATALTLAALALGAVVGSRVAPHVLHEGSRSPYTPLVALVGALVGAMLFQAGASLAGSFARGGLSVIPPLRMLDSIGGLVAGAALGLGAVWVVGAVLLQLPGQAALRRDVQRSTILQHANEIASPSQLLRAFARFDPFEQLLGPAPPTLPPDRRVLQSAGVLRARPSVVRITATACGLDVEGSGWVARPHEVVTAAHVVAGAQDIVVAGAPAQALVVDRHEDIAVLSVPGLSAPPLSLAVPTQGSPVAILGYPEDGPFDARAGRVGTTADVVLNGSLREVTALSGLIRHGNSGGPAVDAAGQVVATVFASRLGGGGGYGVPDPPVREALSRARAPVSTGSC
jgi:S1-C subfamily serine protease